MKVLWERYKREVMAGLGIEHHQHHHLNKASLNKTSLTQQFIFFNINQHQQQSNHT
jgi:hypothetical protein